MGERNLTRRHLLSYSSYLLAGFALTACGSSPQQAPSSSSSHPASSRFRFAQAAPFLSLDPTATSRLESHRITAQILEPIVSADPNTGLPTPGLAQDWQLSEDGLTYQFTLAENLTYSDGSPLTAQDILSNLERWKSIASKPVSRITQPFHLLFSPQGQTQPLLVSWKAPQDQQLQLTLSRPSHSFLQALTQPCFRIMKPGSWERTDQGGYLLGTGAYKLSSLEGNRVTLSLQDHYRGSTPSISELEFITLPAADKRYFQLLEGGIDAYDQISLKDYVPLALDGYPVQSRDPYALAYLNINLSHPAFDDLRVRQALALALDPSPLVSSYYPQGSASAQDFLPALFQIRNDGEAATYRQDLTQAKTLLRASTYANQVIDFYYPLELATPALPSPEGIYSLLSAQLTKAGFNINPKPYSWSDQDSEDIPSSHPGYGLELTGFTGPYRDPLAFLSQVLAPAANAPSHISSPQSTASPTASPSLSPDPASWPTQSASSYQSIMEAISQADSLSDLKNRRQAYQQVNSLIAQLLPAVPLVYPVSAVTYRPAIKNYQVRANCMDDFSSLSIQG